MNSSDPRPQRSLFQNYLLLGLVALVLGTVYAIVLWRTQSSAGETSVLAAAADSGESFADVQSFTLIDSNGKTITRESLLGRASIFGFVFTRCTGPCPGITSNMRQIQDRIAGEDVRLVTITVDPEYDTPEILSQYARNIGADSERWLFLTGPAADVLALSEKSFLLPIARDDSKPIGESITHRTYLTVVDKRGRVRGYYDGEGKAGLDAAVARALFVAREP